MMTIFVLHLNWLLQTQTLHTTFSLTTAPVASNKIRQLNVNKDSVINHVVLKDDLSLTCSMMLRKLNIT
jgi:hypothetical protein